ncbi:glutathione reductase [Suhomyces tanzawaensis NRRL Y-17324]|uniref:Glutathione reductase n=1 Tax=Suhomyces tanzawaensis NRRL Y-17324 TaxID=984487 RepID=A0A1E4SH14_9ASCO|nr:glutathione reductase [Suhomyces tanzawaensis NRRL Y-17324]ODV78803.1 glutathione reductase [Suhomyces tanzawaensis NRRL Y-17324]
MAPTSSLNKFDYLVIGGGSGGVASARRAAKYGAKVLVIEANFNKLGGTCVNVGCVPKKVMWYAADAAHKKHHLKSYGLSQGDDEVKYGDFAWGAIKEKRDAYVTRLNGIYERNLQREGVSHLFGRAKFINSAGDVEVTLTGDQEIKFLEEGKTFQKDEKLVFSGEHILIATGGAPIVPPDVEGADLGITSDGFFQLESQPKSVAVVGAGYIGVELSGIFQSVGSETHLVIRGDTVLRSFDDIIQNTITDYYTDKLGVNVVKKSGSVTKVEGTKDGKKKVHLGNGQVLEVDTLVWTVGRKGLIDLGLDLVDVKINSKGQIEADEYQQTANPKIYSLGDVVGKVELTPVAIAAGRRLSNRLFSGKPEFAEDKLDYSNVPSVIFSHPEAGSIGLSTKEAIEKYGESNVKVYNSKFTAMYYAMMESDDLKSPTVYRIVCTGEDEKVVGLHIVGDASAEILQGFGVAIKMGATKKDFDNCVAIHPTSAEELVTMT